MLLVPLHVIHRITGNSTYAAVVAIIGANIVLVTYIVLSIMDDKREKEPTMKSGGPVESKKAR